MKLKGLLVVAVSALVSINAFAGEIQSSQTNVDITSKPWLPVVGTALVNDNFDDQTAGADAVYDSDRSDAFYGVIDESEKYPMFVKEKDSDATDRYFEMTGEVGKAYNITGGRYLDSKNLVISFDLMVPGPFTPQAADSTKLDYNKSGKMGFNLIGEATKFAASEGFIRVNPWTVIKGDKEITGAVDVWSDEENKWVNFLQNVYYEKWVNYSFIFEREDDISYLTNVYVDGTALKIGSKRQMRGLNWWDDGCEPIKIMPVTPSKAPKTCIDNVMVYAPEEFKKLSDSYNEAEQVYTMTFNYPVDLSDVAISLEGPFGTTNISADTVETDNTKTTIMIPLSGVDTAAHDYKLVVKNVLAKNFGYIIPGVSVYISKEPVAYINADYVDVDRTDTTILLTVEDEDGVTVKPTDSAVMMAVIWSSDGDDYVFYGFGLKNVTASDDLSLSVDNIPIDATKIKAQIFLVDSIESMRIVSDVIEKDI